MAFTTGYVVNEGTQFEFTVSNETIQEMVQQQDTGIIESDIQAYCYTALIDSRVKKLIAHGSEGAWDGQAVNSFAVSNCAGIFGSPLSGGITDRNPMFNIDLIEGEDQCYQRNFLAWEGTIYPNTENAKTGLFLVMDMVDIKRFYVNYDNGGFYTDTVSSGVGGEPPEGYVFPGYAGTVYGYSSASYAQGPAFHTDNNDPMLNPDCNLKLINVLVLNDELWIASLNPSSHGPSSIGSSGYNNAANSLYGWYWGASTGGNYLVETPSSGEALYQAGSINFGAWPDYTGAPDYPGCYDPNAGVLAFGSYVVCPNNDNCVVQMAGSWGQQNYASSNNVAHNSLTTDEFYIKKWMSWCGLKFQYNNTMYKPIIEGGVIVGYSDDMDAESEYDDMTNVTGNNISPTPPVPPAPPYPDDDDWDNLTNGPWNLGGTGFLNVYTMSVSELSSLETWLNSTSLPEGFDPLPSIIGLSEFPVDIPGGTASTIKFVNTNQTGNDRIIDSGVSANRLNGVGTGCHFTLGSYTIGKKFANDTAFLDYDTLVEIYVPFCGVFPVDTQAVMGRTVSGDIWVDPISGGCFAMITCSLDNGGKTPLIMAEGSMNINLPVSSQQYGVIKAAQNTNIGNFISGAIGTAVGLATTAIVGGQIGSVKAITEGAALGVISESTPKLGFVMGATETMGRQGAAVLGGAARNTYNVFRTNKMLQAANSTAIKGGLGGSFASWAQPWQAYVKITRYNKQVPGNYASTAGLPVVDTKTIGNYADGDFIVAVNPKVSGISGATAEELSQIYNALTSGVYI